MTVRSTPRRNKPLATGYTTGTCAAAAAKGALSALCGRPLARVGVCLPAGETATLAVLESGVDGAAGLCAVRKNAGDDPDVTNGAVIRVRVTLRDDALVQFCGGPGVGTVTRPGLAVPPGEPAVNPVPRQMVQSALQELLPPGAGVTVTISVDGGEVLAQKTLNPRLGIVGGISILGTTGIVIPYSHDAYRDSIVCALDVARAAGSDRVVLSTGKSSERAAGQLLPDLPETAFVLMADHFAFSVQKAAERGFQEIVCAFFPGKLLKVAAGAGCTHCSASGIDLALLAQYAAEMLSDAEAVVSLREANTVRHAIGMLPPDTAQLLCRRLAETVAARVRALAARQLAVSVIVLQYDGSLICRIEKK